MQKKDKYPKINVLNVVRGFKKADLPHHIMPYRFELKNGDVHRIQSIRQTHRERVGKGYHYHYVVVSTEERYFHLVFETEKLVWRLIQEVDKQLFFS